MGLEFDLPPFVGRSPLGNLSFLKIGMSTAEHPSISASSFKPETISALFISQVLEGDACFPVHQQELKMHLFFFFEESITELKHILNVVL